MFQVPRFIVPGFLFQVPGSLFHVPGFLFHVPSSRFQIPGVKVQWFQFRMQVPGAMGQPTSGSRFQGSQGPVSGIQVPGSRLLSALFQVPGSMFHGQLFNAGFWFQFLIAGNVSDSGFLVPCLRTDRLLNHGSLVPLTKSYVPRDRFLVSGFCFPGVCRFQVPSMYIVSAAQVGDLTHDVTEEGALSSRGVATSGGSKLKVCP